MKNILLTGGTGFVGNQVLNSLRKLDVSIRLIVREQSKITFYENLGIKTFYLPDLFNTPLDQLQFICNDVNIVIHCAWYVEPINYLNNEKNLDCLVGTLNLAKACIFCGVERFIGVGSCFEYKMASKTLSINAQIAPTSLYSATKASTFYILKELFKNSNVSFLWARLFYMFGEGENEDRLYAYIHKKLSNGLQVELTEGSQIRDYMDVTEVGKILATTSLSNKVGAVNICSGKPQSVKQIANEIANIYGNSHLLAFGARPTNIYDPKYIVGVPSF